ncbi:MAG: type II toxin-antitoxin system YafQ family toxin [Prevotella sp.]|nr:type II toxin-antitoxin system YafQ family toxin [Candidatus Prevotella equi]
MYSLEYSGQFKRDLKLMAKRGLNIEEMRTVLNFLANEGQVPASYLPHVLKGKYAGIWECHINPDWLLMYDITDSIKLVRLVRTGTHSDLFKK